MSPDRDDMDEDRDGAGGDTPVDPPAPLDPEAVADAPEQQPDDAERPVDDTEFIYPSENDSDEDDETPRGGAEGRRR